MSRSLRIIGWLALLVILALIGKGLYSYRRELLAFSWNFDPLFLALSFCALAATFVYVGLVWLLLLRFLGCDCAAPGALKIYFYSSLGNYLPGKVWQIAGAAAMGSLQGHSGLAFGLASFYLAILNILSGFLVTFASLFLFDFNFPMDDAVRMAAMALTLSTLLFFYPPINRWIFRLAGRVLGKSHAPPSIPARKLLLVIALLAGHWILEAYAFQLFIESFYPLQGGVLRILTAIVAFSSTMGFLALFMPAGIGVRDGLFVLLLPLIMPQAIALATAVGFRVWFTIVNLASVLLACLFIEHALGGRKADH